VLAQGSTGGHFFVIRSGAVRFVRAREGGGGGGGAAAAREKEIGRLAAGQYV